MSSWVADPGVHWRILLSAGLVEAPEPASVRSRLQRLVDQQGWGGETVVELGPDADELRRRLAQDERAPVVVGLAGPTLVVSAHHSRVDGLGLLEVLARLGGGPVTSTARGVADRPRDGGLPASVARRLVEVATSPPARVARTGASGGTGDTMVHCRLDRVVHTAGLVHAAVSAVGAHNASLGRSARHVAVAVGAARPAGLGQPLADRSELLRLRDLEDRSLAEVERLVREAPTQPSPAGTGPTRGHGLRDRAVRVGLRALAPRLGSTVLVSHLGEVTAPAARDLVFHPVSGGGSGLSLGAVTHDGRTVLSLRARGGDHDHDGLERLLAAVAGGLR